MSIGRVKVKKSHKNNFNYFKYATKLLGLSKETFLSNHGLSYCNFYFIIMRYLVFAIFLTFPLWSFGQIIFDDFEGNGNITSWVGDDCQINLDVTNPFQRGINTSSKVMQYQDIGGQYANVRFETKEKLDLSKNAQFKLKVYLPSNTMIGNQIRQISLKLQNGDINEPWTTQSEIIKPLVADEWQTVTFDFAKDNFMNLDPSSIDPVKRKDFNRIVIQINGENNNNRVVAFLDDVFHDGDFVQSIYNQLIWSDEFDKNGAVDPAKWFHQTRIPMGDSWFNGELQHYTNRLTNSFVENGMLNIVARKENFTNQGVTKQYTSARLNSKFAFKYGKVVMRAKLPSGRGTWPAFWTLGKNINENGAYWQTQGFGTTPWPACGEIDIMEHWGRNQNIVESATHTPSSFGNTINKGGQFIANASTGFNLYELEWTPNELIFSVNGVVHFVYDPEIKDNRTWPFDNEQYFLLNIAIEPTIAASFTQSAMQIDYIRVYQQSPLSQTESVNSIEPHYYPNPVNDVLHLRLNEPTPDQISVKIVGLEGKIWIQQTYVVHDQEIIIDSWSHLPQGIYFIQYEINNKLKSVKILK